MEDKQSKTSDVSGVTVTSSGGLHVNTTSVLSSDSFQRRLDNIDRIFDAGAKGLLHNVQGNTSSDVKKTKIG